MKFIERVLVSGSAPQSVVADLGFTILRVTAGAMMAPHGWGKLPPTDEFVSGVGEMGFPMPIVFAWVAALSEFVGGILLAVGFLTRPAAFFIAGTMATAAFVVHADDPFSDKEMALLYLATMIAFMLAGSGRFSIDRMVRKSVLKSSLT